MLKSDQAKLIQELETQVKFTIELLDKKTDELFELRQENLKLKKQLGILVKDKDA